MKRLLFIFFHFCFCISVATAQRVTISTLDDLTDFCTNVNSGYDYSGQTVVLMDNVEFSAYDYWTPIGTEEHPFCGTFDGNGFEIVNLNVAVDADNTDYLAGFFGKIGADGVVKDVVLSGEGSVYIDQKSYDWFTCHVGSIAGVNEGTIIGCANKSIAVYGNWDNAEVGGIVGTNSGSVIACYNLGNVYTGPSYQNNVIGGIAGYDNGTISNCLVNATISRELAGNSHGHPICGNTGMQSNVSGCIFANGSPYDVTVNLTLDATADNTTALSTANEQTKNVLLNHHTLLTNGVWNTLCLPFDIEGIEERSPIAGATVMELSAIDVSDNIVSLTFTDAANIKAGKPYIVRWDNHPQASIENPVFFNVTIGNIQPDPFISANMDMKFVGSYAPTPLRKNVSKNLYLDHENHLCWPTEDFSLGAFQACFLPTGPSSEIEYTLADLKPIVENILGKEDAEHPYDHDSIDLNGDGSVSLSDLTALVTWLTTHTSFTTIKTNVGIATANE